MWQQNARMRQFTEPDRNVSEWFENVPRQSTPKQETKTFFEHLIFQDRTRPRHKSAMKIPRTNQTMLNSWVET